MRNLHRIPKSFALSFALSVAATSAAIPDTRATLGQFANLKLAMSEQQTIAALRSYVTHPQVGFVCNGAYGVSAYVPYQNQTWQLMAHIDREKDAVTELRMVRSTRKGIENHADCARNFADVLDQFMRNTGMTQWETQSTDLSRASAYHARATAQQVGAMQLRLTADRSVRERALCNIEIIVTADGKLPVGWKPFEAMRDAGREG